MEPDFSGWATKVNLKCSDGRVIMPDAFAHMDGQKVPLVWQHMHGDPGNILGHAILSAKPEGVWAEGYFNDSASATDAKNLVVHGDVNTLSIYANQLVEKSKQVFHGMIREVSLVISGANPGAKIENIRLAHGFDDELETLEDEAIIYTGLSLSHADEKEDSVPNETKEKTVQDIYDSMTDEQKDVVHYMIGLALEGTDDEDGDKELAQSSFEHADGMTLKQLFETLNEDQKNLVYYMVGLATESAEEDAEHGDTTNNLKGDAMSRNLFEQTDVAEGPVLTHTDLETINENAKKIGSFKEAFMAHAESLGYGVDDIDFLFPDAKTLSNNVDLISRRTEWVKDVMGATKHSPFSRIKSIVADITADEARAKGYVKGNLKKDEVIRLLKRVTTPTTVYKKQKLDRDDVLDITDLDVVAWLKWEMRFMLEEELARAVLIGDGREPDDEDKIDEEKLRPVAWDHDMYSHSVTVPTSISPDGIVESILRARKFYKGTGTPTFYTTDDILTDMILIKDKMGRRIYNTEVELAAALRVSKIVVVEVMEDTPDLLGIIVNLADYTIGADKGGQLSMFDDFDIDYNQQKYLIETRISGALTKPKSAVVIKRTSGTTVTPLVPEFDSETNTITVPTVAGVSYFNVTDPLSEVELTDGADVVITKTTDVEARPDAGYSFPHNTDADWTFAYTA